MIETSSKRLSKIKKKLKKHQTSEYYFLISSLQRDQNKENYSSNHLNHNKTSLRNSIDLQKSSIINSFDNCKHLTHEKNFDKTQLLNNSRQRTKINIKNSNSVNQNPPFFENVKFLKNSRIIEDPKPDDQCKKKIIAHKNCYKKNIELSQSINSRVFQQIKEPKSNKFIQDTGDSLEQKLLKYLKLVNEIFEEIMEKYRFDKSSSFSRKKLLIQALGNQLLNQAKQGPDIKSMKNLSKSIEVSNFSSFPSKVISRQLQKSINLKQKSHEKDLQKKLIELYEENNMLSHLVSQHERKNIKMYVKMNSNQSDQIESCKKILQNLFKKYKSLEKFIVKQNQKYKKAENQKKCLQSTVKKLQTQNEKLRQQLQRFKVLVDEMNSQTLSKLSFDEQIHSNTIFNFNISGNDSKYEKKPQGNQQLMHQQSQQIHSKMEKSFVTKRDKAASCLSKHTNDQVIKNKDDEIMSCSTITKTKNMKKKKPQASQKISMGVNLKDQFDQIGYDQIQNLKKQISELKGRLNDEMILKLGLQKQVNSLQSGQRKGKERLQRRQEIIHEQLQEIEKLMETNKRLQNELRQSKEMKLNKAANIQSRKDQKEVDKILEQIKRFSQIKPAYRAISKNQGGNSYQDSNESEYRIIAMQASLIQSLLSNQG